MDAFGTWKAKKGVKEMERRQSKHFRRQFGKNGQIDHPDSE